jgi:hypothetical protein
VNRTSRVPNDTPHRISYEFRESSLIACPLAGTEEQALEIRPRRGGRDGLPREAKCDSHHAAGIREGHVHDVAIT